MIKFFYKEQCSILAFCVFIIMLHFYYFYHPIVIYDTDDWINLSMHRSWLPTWGTWNPSKVLPEKLTKIACYLASRLLYPTNGDFVNSVSILTEILVSAIIAICFYRWYKFLKKFIHHNLQILLFFVFVFLTHFAIYRQTNNCTYLFYSCNLTCYYHYVIPVFLNMTVVLYLFANEYHPLTILGNVFVIIGSYFAIFSNILSSPILAGFTGSFLLFKLCEKKISFILLKKYIKNNYLPLLVIGIWFISVLFEAFGGRAKSIGKILDFSKSFHVIWITLLKLHPIFLCVSIILLMVGIILYFRNQLFHKKLLLQIIVSWFLYFSAVFVIGTKAGAWYIVSPHTFVGFYFYWFLLLAILYVDLNAVQEKAHLAFIPVIVGVCICLMSGGKYRESNMRNISPAKCVQVDNFIIEQVIKMEKNIEKRQFDLIVPKGDDNDNWPHANYGGRGVARTLKYANVVHKQLHPKFKASIEINQKFQLGYIE